MQTEAKVTKKESSKPVAKQAPKVRAVYDSAARKLHGAHGIGCRN